MEDTEIPEIVWFKTVYVIEEDRMRFSCSLKDGGTDCFWLTQRLANALVRQLTEWLDKNSIQDRRHAEASHRMAQQSAMASRPKKAFRELPEAAGWLVNSVKIGTGPRGLMMTFKDDGERALGLRFDVQHLRQWLNVFRAQYRRSGWSTVAWPDWMTDVAGERPAEGAGLLH
jgi:hypothetical protein